jgi:hypothetical protein
LLFIPQHTQFVWGVTRKQQKGQKCVRCGLKVHEKCVLNAGECVAADKPQVAKPASAASGADVWTWEVKGLAAGSGTVILTHSLHGTVDRTESVSFDLVDVTGP